MTDMPQELVVRVAAKMWAEEARNTPGVYKRRTPASFREQHDDVVSQWQGLATTAIAAMLDGVRLDLDDIHGDGSTLVVKTEAMMPITAMPCGKHHYAGTQYPNIADAKAAALADYRARMLKAMCGGM